MRIEVCTNDLFSPILRSEIFDVIAFNPPYLPAFRWATSNEKTKPKRWLEKAWEGGSLGIETTLAFLGQVGDHLASAGLIYLVSSSTNELSKTLSSAEIYQLHFKVKDFVKFPFEILYLLEGERLKIPPSVKEQPPT